MGCSTKTKPLSPLLCLMLAFALPEAFGQASGDDSWRNQYEYCQDRAREVSRYYGAVPVEYERRSGGAIEGALKGASNAAGWAWITGGDEKKAAKRGAALGAIIGAIKKGKQDQRRRENQTKRRHYERELDACMRDGRRR